jgi:predicted Zn-dependent peptidase
MAVTFQRAVLGNGLTIIGETDPAAHTAAIGFFVKTGARDEDSRVMGVSHFLEHMMFKGTPKRSAEQVNVEFDAMGARANAYTSAEMTAFYASVLPEQLPKATDLLADMMRPALRDEDFTTEKGVILEEIAMYADEPIWVLHDAMGEAYWPNHPLGHRVLGTSKTITDLTSEQMRTYFTTRYSADNTAVAITGNVNFDAAVKQLETLCGHWQRTDARRHYSAPTTAELQSGASSSLGRAARTTFSLSDEKVTRAYRLLTAPGPASADADRYAAFVAAQILGDSGNSRLHWALIETGLAEEAEASFEPMDGLGVLRVLIATEPDNLEAAWTKVEQELAGLASSITPEDVQRVRSKVATGIVVAGERPEGRMHRLGRLWTYLGHYTPLEEELDRVNAVTVADVRALLTRYPFAPAVVGTLSPG